MREKISTWPKTFYETRAFYRFLEILTGSMTWIILIAPFILSLTYPIFIAYFIIAFDLYWLFKSIAMSRRLIIGYRRLHKAQKADWLKKLEKLNNLDSSASFASYAEAKELNLLLQKKDSIIDWRNIYHAIVIALSFEDRETIEATVKALLVSNYPADKLVVVIAYEERAGKKAEDSANYLLEKYGQSFFKIVAYKHPDGLPGEVRGKGANITFAGRQMKALIDELGIDYENVIVTTLDADHRADKEYLPYLTYAYVTDPTRTKKSFQPMPMFYNNIWYAPAPMRVIATSNSFWMVMEALRPHRLRNFAAHAQSLKTLIDTDFWSTTTIVEDGHQFWRTYFTYDGDHRVEPLFIPVYQDAVLAETYKGTYINQYKQLRRWAWGVSDIPFVIVNSLRNNRIPIGSKLAHLGRLVEGHLSWATAPLIMTYVAWLPLTLNSQFKNEVIANQLPVIASRILTFAMIGLVVTIWVSLISLPERPKAISRRRSLAMLLQWAIVPLSTILLSAIPAIEAHTRLLFGKYLEFWVTEKKGKVE